MFTKLKRALRGGGIRLTAVTPPRLLSRTRAEEQLRVHHGGDPRNLIDLVRSALVFESLDDIYTALAEISTRAEIVRFEDRFAKPTALGYSDIALNVRMPNGHIVSQRLLLEAGLDAKPAIHARYLDAIGKRARARLADEEPGGYAVAIIDQYQYQTNEGATLVGGFASAELAEQYARRRVRDSVAELRNEQTAAAQLRRKWWLFGEDALALGPGLHTSMGLDVVVTEITEPGDAEQRDWAELGEDLGVWTEALDPRA